MKRSTIWIVGGVIVVAVIALIVGLVVSKKHERKDEGRNTTVDEASTTANPIRVDDWICVFMKGPYDSIICPVETVYIPKKGIYDYSNISSYIECTDINKKVFAKGTYHGVTGNDTYFIEKLKCNTLQPCIAKFKICVHDPDPDPKYPLISLECKRVKDFPRNENEDTLLETQNIITNTLADSENVTCGACGEEQNTKTYIMDSGFHIGTKIVYSCEEVRIEKAIPE